MGKKAIEIVDLEVKKLVETLNQALSEEWLAYYQYWIGARVMSGPMHGEIEKELYKHADEELRHAEMLARRIIELDGTPVLSPEDWPLLSKCKYEAPVDAYIESILKQNLSSERCAIHRYEKLAQLTDGKDFTTFSLATQILADEVEHETDLESCSTTYASSVSRWWPCPCESCRKMCVKNVANRSACLLAVRLVAVCGFL